MKVLYLGKYREPAVNYHGAVFTSGVATEVTDEWFALHFGPNIVAADSAPVVEAEPVIEAPKRRGRPPKVANDDNN